MALSMNVTFSGELAEKIQRLATLRHQDIDSLFETLVEQALPEQSESDEIATPEMKTYIALHPMLKQKYFGQYVAIYQGKLIGHDRERETLYRRIDAQYPDKFVWISRVEEDAISTRAFHERYIHDSDAMKKVIIPRPGSITEKLWGALGQGNGQELSEIFSYDYDYELSKR